MNTRKVTLTTRSGKLISRRVMTAITAVEEARSRGVEKKVIPPPALRLPPLLRRTTGQGAPVGKLVVHARDVDPLDAGPDEDVDLGVEERQPADLGDRDLLRLVVELGPLGKVIHCRVGFLRQPVELG